MHAMGRLGAKPRHGWLVERCASPTSNAFMYHLKGQPALIIMRDHLDGISSYQPLLQRQIRVLVLQPGQKGSRLVADLRAIDLLVPSKANEPPSDLSKQLQEDTPIHDSSFEAISYCWGAADFREVLHLITGCTLRITPSLYAVLQAFRYTDRPRVLWADAVCINQQDTTERSSQVAMMGEIYASASRVLVWLGETEANGTEGLAFVTLHAGLKEDQRRPDRPELKMTMDEIMTFLEDQLRATSRCSCCGDEMDLSKPSAIQGLVSVGKLLDRAWFTRLWVVQEVALADIVEIYCGTHHASWANFRAVIFHLWNSGPSHWPRNSIDEQDEFSKSLSVSRLQWMWEQFVYIGYYRSNATRPFVPSKFFQGIINLSTRSCQEPHDRIFSVRNIFGIGDIEALRPDYSIPAAEIYRRATLLCLTSPSFGCHKAVMLALAGTEKRVISSTVLPSWVPDLHHLSSRSHAKYMRYEATKAGSFYADDLAFQCRISAENVEELLVRGLCFAEIDKILVDSTCPAAYPEDHNNDASDSGKEGVAIIRWFLRCRRFLLEHAKLTGLYDEADRDYYMSEDDQLEGIDQEIYTITCTDDLPDIPPSEMVDYAVFSQWMSQIPVQELDPLLPEHTLRQSLRPFISGQPHPRYDRERNLCCTKGEYGALAGWVPVTARSGDFICHLTGAQFPFVLRSNNNISNTFTLLGDAFVHGAEERSVLRVDPNCWKEFLERRRENRANVDRWSKEIGEARLTDDHNTNERRKHALKQWNHYTSVRVDLQDEGREMYRKAAQECGWLRIR